MKYIRTKYGIYKSDKVSIVKENDIELVILGICDETIERTRGKTWNCETNIIIDQADTIEELCDEFVGIGTDNSKLVWRKVDFDDLKEGILSNKGWAIIYGAIWTEKGLIYVAKMNNKGELELLC